LGIFGQPESKNSSRIKEERKEQNSAAGTTAKICAGETAGRMVSRRNMHPDQNRVFLGYGHANIP